MASLLADQDGAPRVRRSLAERTVTLEEILGRSLSFDEVAGALGAAAEKVLGVSLFQGMLEEEEAAAVERIMREAEDPFAT
jgi:lipoate-protein ligase A